MKLVLVLIIAFAYFVGWIWKRRAVDRGKRPLEPVRPDLLASADSRDRDLLLDIQSGKISKLRTALSRCREGRWEERAFYVSLAPHIKRAELDAWVTCEPRSTEALLLRAQHAVSWAWRARGEGRAKDVGDRAWKIFFERLNLARADLETCIALDDVDPTPWLGMIQTVHLEEDPLAKTLSFVDEVLTRDPNAFSALWLAIAFLGPRWYGSQELALGFARRHAYTAEPTNEHAMLLFKAHFEAWFYLEVFEENRAAADAWLASNEVHVDLDSAYAASLGATSHRATKMTPTLRNFAAMTFYRMRDRTRLRCELELLGNAASSRLPWSMLGEETLEAAKRFAR